MLNCSRPIHPNRMDSLYDLLIVGGGINGAGIARDAAGRGLSVQLVEQGDIGGATSSSSSKMIHGGLRYLEHYEFRLVSEARAEREVMLRIAPHLARPLSIVMPHVPSLRPAWMIRLGLILYDTLGRLRERSIRTMLPASATVDLRRSPLGATLNYSCTRGFVYSDVSDDDARLTLATALSASELGAKIDTRTRCIEAWRKDGLWHVILECEGVQREVRTRALVNAAGPWVAEFLNGPLAKSQPTSQPNNTDRPRPGVQLIRGSHIVVPKFYEGEHGYLLQNDDRRVVFVLPFEEYFALIGTTEIKVAASEASRAPVATPEEIAYLCRAVSRFCRHPVTPESVVWRYSGLRPLYDDGHSDPADITRDYVFVLDSDAGTNSSGKDSAPLLSVFGGKLTTHRRLAEAALEKLSPWFPQMRGSWTATQALPGGDFKDFAALHAELCRCHPQLPADWLRRLARRHGSRAERVLTKACTLADLGEDFGGGLHEREVEYFITAEWACSAEDILWRRGKFGLHMTAQQREGFGRWLERRWIGQEAVCTEPASTRDGVRQ